ncbi:LYR motif-containing protein 4 isoform X1 [Elgaria multicarinata webbii]|uniref:LYR motif-containing protein 4 isoform X1 n=1 Tax=Elgaria multicarinata webbii TaxID=159646 RepID=UPI002FCCBB86
MAASRRAQVLRLYRALLRESQGFTAYGYRTYAVRRIRDAFRENKSVKDSAEVETLVNKAKTNLEMIRRQVHRKIGSCLILNQSIGPSSPVVSTLTSRGSPGFQPGVFPVLPGDAKD